MCTSNKKTLQNKDCSPGTRCRSRRRCCRPRRGCRWSCWWRRTARPADTRHVACGFSKPGAWLPCQPANRRSTWHVASMNQEVGNGKTLVGASWRRVCYLSMNYDLPKDLQRMEHNGMNPYRTLSLPQAPPLIVLPPLPLPLCVAPFTTRYRARSLCQPQHIPGRSNCYVP